MEKQFELTVLVVTYEPDLKSLYRTLYSVLMQKNVDYEIVISDDGSESFERKPVEDFFKSYGFSDYTLVLNPVNQGTVKNMISGLSASRGRYVKDISAGDFLYDEYSLRNALDLLRDNNAPFVFGRSVHYSLDGENIKLYNRSYPMDLNAYVQKDSDRILFNYLFHRDYILGASFVIDTQLYLEYLKRIEERIKYTEDASVIFMVADGIQPLWMDQYFVWYETGEGISTSSNDRWTAILAEENREVYRILGEQGLYDKNVCRWWSGGKKNLLIQIWRVYHRLWCDHFFRKQRKADFYRGVDLDNLKRILFNYRQNTGE